MHRDKDSFMVRDYLRMTVRIVEFLRSRQKVGVQFNRFIKEFAVRNQSQHCAYYNVAERVMFVYANEFPSNSFTISLAKPISGSNDRTASRISISAARQSKFSSLMYCNQRPVASATTIS